MLKVVHDAEASNEIDPAAGRSLLDEIVRDGARQMLAAALQAEVAAYVETHAGEVDGDGHRLVVRNGHHQARQVTTARVRCRCGRLGAGFHGIRDAKAVDDLIKQRASRDRSTEVAPAPGPGGRGDELADREDGEQQSDGEGRCAEGLRVEREQRNDDAEADLSGQRVRHARPPESLEGWKEYLL